MRFYTASKLGSKRAYTPEGFLVCLDVPIARTGEMLYAPEELDLEPGRDGLIHVERSPEEVFKPEAMASFVGKPTTNDHPPVQVEPSNYKLYAAGSVQNVRQGQGIQADLMLADLIWWDPDTIAAIEGGKDEISCGYDAAYEVQDTPGRARQVGISGNHVALVESGRCGERCAIGDSAAALQATTAAEKVMANESAPSCRCGGHTHDRDARPAAKPARASKRKTRDMTKPTKLRGSMLDRVRRAFTAKDEAGFEEAMTAVESAAEESAEAAEKAEFASMIGEAVASAIAPVVQRLDAIEAAAAATPAVETPTDDETPEEKAAREKADAEKAAAEAAADKRTKDNEALAAFLKAKGLSDEDIAEACKMLATADSPEAGDLGGDPSDTGPGDPDGGATAPLYNAGASSQIGDEDSPEEKAKAEKMTADAANFSVVFRDSVARAEILAPGVKLPTYDGKATKKKMQDALCALRRAALVKAFASDDRKKHVAPFVADGAPDFAKMSCGAVKMIFAGASELAKAANNRPVAVTDTATRAETQRQTIAGWNAANRDFWKRG